MGQFSWLDCITQEQILDDVPRKSYVLVPQQFGGGHIEESCYEGYGVFGGRDVYQLVAEWNCPEKCNGEVDDDRLVGIDIACYDKDNASLRFPIKITHDPSAVYEWCAPSKGDPNQGWPWPYDGDDEWWWDEDE